MFFDLLYIAVVINYCSQCQLLTYYVENLIDKVQNKKYKNLNDAIKVIIQPRSSTCSKNNYASLVNSALIYESFHVKIIYPFSLSNIGSFGLFENC